MGSNIDIGLVYGFAIDTDGAIPDELDEYLCNLKKPLGYQFAGDMQFYSMPIIHLKNMGVISYSCFQELSPDYIRGLMDSDIDTEALDEAREFLVSKFADKYDAVVSEVGWILYGSYG